MFYPLIELKFSFLKGKMYTVFIVTDTYVDL